MRIRIFTLVVLCLFSFCTFSQSTILTQLGSNINYVVAKDGTGQYTTVQAAVNAVPNNSTTAKVIFVKQGTYTEKVEVPSTKTNLILIGENATNTIIAYNDYTGSGKIYNGIITSANGVAIGTSTSYTLYVAANDFTMMNITVQNTAGDVGQAVAFNSNGDRHFLYHCRLVGYQDTYYTWNDGRFYVKDSYIEGAIDYIFGRGVALFDSCQIQSVRSNSYITAAATDQNFKYGYVFNNCKLTAASGISSVYLGRPWKAYGQTVYMNSDEGSFLNTGGWSIWSGTTNNTTCYYAEYKNCGTGSNTSNRVSWSYQLTATEAANYTKVNLFDKAVNPTPYSSSWNPDPETNAIYKVIKNNTTRFITSACFQTTPTDCNNTANGTAKLDNCDRCVAGTTGKTACVSAGEAETDACSFDGVTETTNTGFKGTSYINVNNVVGSSITFSITAANAGSATLSFRYANGGANDRPAQITLNNAVQSNNLSFPVTGAFTTWKVVDFQVTLSKGANTLKLSSTTAEGMANIDQIGYVSTGLAKGSCVVTGLEEVEEFKEVVVYPNPFTSNINLISKGSFVYSILDQTGKVLESGTGNGEVTMGANLPAGMYMIQIQQSQFSKVISIVKR